MPSNYDTLPLQSKLNKLATNRAMSAISQGGKCLPCKVIEVNGSIVTVSFDVQSGTPWTLPNVTIPKAESQWLRLPTQVDDMGLAVPADTFLGNVSGLGSGTPNLTVNYGNLTSLVWVPVANTGFSTAPATNEAWLNGPGGARIGDSTNAVYVECHESSGTVTIKAGGNTWTFSSAGLTMSTGIVAETHLHSGVQTGEGDTGPPIS